jgi:hypothetical protein
MLTTPLFQLFLKHARYVGLGALFAILPVSGRASMITEQVNFTVNGLNGVVTFTVDTNPGDPSHSTSDGSGAYADPNDGLLSLNLQYNSVNYTLADFLDTPFLPIVLLPGNTKLAGGLNYELIGAVVTTGSCTGSAGAFTCTGPPPSNEATVLGFGPTVEADFVTGVATVDASVSGSTTILSLHGNGIRAVQGSITSESISSQSTVPEPALAPISAAALAGLWFVRRRKATKA